MNVPCPSQNSESEWHLSADYWHDVRVALRKRHGDIFILPQCAAGGDLSAGLELVQCPLLQGAAQVLQAGRVPEARAALLDAAAVVGNPSSPHAMGRKARAVLDTAREIGEKRAHFLHAPLLDQPLDDER